MHLGEKVCKYIVERLNASLPTFLVSEFCSECRCVSANQLVRHSINLDIKLQNIIVHIGNHEIASSCSSVP